MDARAGSLWHMTAGVAIPRNSPRHGGGPLCFRQEDQPEADLVVPVLEVLFCCCPASVQSVLARLYQTDQHQDKHDNTGDYKEDQTEV